MANTIVIPSISPLVLGSQFDKTNATLADITGFSFVLVPGTYVTRATLIMTPSAAGGFKLAISGTATFSNIRISVIVANWTTLGNTIVQQFTAKDDSSNTSATGPTIATAEYSGAVTCSVGGTFTLQFAQNSASGTSSIVPGSIFEVNPIG